MANLFLSTFFIFWETLKVVDRSLQTKEAAIKLLKFQLLLAQQHMKHQADKGRTYRLYKVGEFVYVKL